MPPRSLFVLVVAACGHAPVAPGADAGPDAGEVLRQVTITAAVDSTRFVTREHMLAGGEMQISGEPLAESMGRDLPNYSRDRIPTDLYYDPNYVLAWPDLAGFSTAIESYEYSKQPMNQLAFESGAGTSLAYGPLLDPAQLATAIQHYAVGANAAGRFVSATGWPGLWPTAHVFESFDPAIDPAGGVARGCVISSDDDPDGMGGAPIISSDYECDDTSLHLRDRASQIAPTITPGADGFASWKYGLWTLNYLQVMHDGGEAPIATVDDLATVGQPGSGVYLGSSDIEGFQAQLMIAMVDNRAADWLTRLSTTDGTTLSGFASVAAALAYDDTAPLRWFPHAIAVTEADVGSGFPKPSFALASADSELMDLVGVTLGYAGFHALTDTRNPAVGGAQAARAMFDGDPFSPDGLHDRALAMMRVALVDLERLHVDPATGILVDHVAMAGATPQRGHTLDTTSLAYAVIGIRTALRSLDAQLGLYSNNTPDTAVAATPFSSRLEQLLRIHAALLLDHLTDASGRAWRGWDVATRAPIDAADTLDAHAAAVRGLFAAYLATGDVRYRARAIAVFDRMEAVFFDREARIYTATPAPVDTVTYTPLRFALVQSALRDMYELVATRPGGEARVATIEDRLARVDKLVLNGWDDRDQNRLVAWPDECVDVVDGLPRGGLQMAERTLTGELGTRQFLPGDTSTPTSDREHDCVPEIDDAHLPAALAASVTFHLVRQ